MQTTMKIVVLLQVTLTSCTLECPPAPPHAGYEGASVLCHPKVPERVTAEYGTPPDFCEEFREWLASGKTNEYIRGFTAGIRNQARARPSDPRVP